MGMLTTRDLGWMENNVDDLYDDFAVDVTIQKLSSGNFSSTSGATTQMDELGWIENAAPAYDFQYTVRAIMQPVALVNRSVRNREDTLEKAEGMHEDYDWYVRIALRDLGVNPHPDLYSELVYEGVTYRILYVDKKSWQLLLGVTNER